VNENKISQETAHIISVSLYQQVSAYLKTAIKENREEYEKFKADYTARQNSQTSSSKKTRQKPNS
jgi:hypothetical protein